jgi:hypothetical protein
MESINKEEIKPYPNSAPAMRNSLNLFSMWSTDISVLDSNYMPCYALSNYKDNHLLPIEFIIPSSHQYYISCYDSFIYAKCRVVKSNGDAIKPKDNIAISQQFGAQMFDTLNIYLN